MTASEIVMNDEKAIKNKEKYDEYIEKHMKERGKLIINVFYFTIITNFYLEFLQWVPSRDWSRLFMLS